MKKYLYELIEKVNKAVNDEDIIQANWELGKLLYDNEKNADYIQEIFSYCKVEKKNISKQKLNEIKKFYKTYKHYSEKELSLLKNLNWSSHKIILSKTKTLKEKEFYIKLAIKENYSVDELERQINSMYFERCIGSEEMLEQKKIKDARILENYSLEFLDLNDIFTESELRKAIVHNLKDFMLELGRDFSFIGEEYRVKVGKEYFFIDLLFYNRSIMSLVAIELKIGEFKPEYISKMNFYLKALDKKVKKTNENPSIGIILCKSKDNEILSCAINGNTSTIIVSEYNVHTDKEKSSKLKNVSKHVQDSLESLLKEDNKVILTEEQKNIQELAKLYAKKIVKNNEKSVLIVKGGPGTGKTTVALNLLCEFIQKNMVCGYVTRNKYSRQIYYKQLNEIKSKSKIYNLFLTPGNFFTSKQNDFDILIVDEAHRLRERSAYF